MGYSFHWQQGICYMHCPIDRIIHTMIFGIPIVGHWLEWEKSAVLSLLMRFNTVISSTSSKHWLSYLLKNHVNNKINVSYINMTNNFLIKMLQTYHNSFFYTITGVENNRLYAKADPWFSLDWYIKYMPQVSCDILIY